MGWRGRKEIGSIKGIDPLGDKRKQVANVGNPDTLSLYLYEQPLVTDMCHSKKCSHGK